MKDELKKIYTYCGLDEAKNIVAKIDSDEIDNWKKSYINGFNEGYAISSDKSLDVRLVYCDPDQTYKKGYNHHFFEQLVRFLNKRELELAERLNGKYDYKFVEGQGIEVSETNQDGEKIVLFYLRSDQLGFSAPSNEKSHPYDLYIMQSQNKDEAVKQVADWIIDSRTIGGAFLWPRPFYDTYNPNRGGKITSSRKYYIQDRVDLTLWEIYYWYTDNNKSTIMTRSDDVKSNLYLWLTHFKDFRTYIEFFCFKDFVTESDEQVYPVDIISGKKCEPKWGEDGQNPEIEITSKLDINKVKGMLERLNNSILNRSIMIEDKLSKL
ncbi:MAG: hypothetical protein UD936_04555 [Acutalibacteraceae bacterium]|nr:hypothetical protein [Acutalibacteraceae bacterium]